MLDLVGNPEDRFSHNEAHLFMSVRQGDLLKNEHITTTYRSFKKINETQFLQDLATDLGPFSDILVDSDINEACSTWIKTIPHQLDHHAPLKSRRVKHKRLPEW